MLNNSTPAVNKLGFRLYQKELQKLQFFDHVDKKTYLTFIERINKGNLTHKINPGDHLCCFFLPIHRATKSIYLGHHIKADDWLPPGGHIEEEELPSKTVIREFKEELDYEPDPDLIVLFDISIKKIDNLRSCKIHYDFWYFVETEKINFNFDRGEFYDAGWFLITDGEQRMKTTSFRQVVQKLKHYLSIR